METPLADVRLEDLEGQTHVLGTYAREGRAVALVFVSVRCPVSNAYHTRLARLGRDLGERGVAYFGVNANADETIAEIREHARQHGLTFPILKDAENHLADRLGAQVTPEAFLFDGTGRLRYHGRIDNHPDDDRVTEETLALAVDAVLAGREPAARQAFQPS